MRDLTDRALDTAASLGAGYADVRIVRRQGRVDRHQVRPGRGRRVRRIGGLRRPRPRRWCLGLRVVVPPGPRRGRSRRRRSPSGSPGRRRPRCASRVVLDGRAAGPRPLRDARSRRTRSRSRSSGRSPISSPPTGRRRREGHQLHRDPAYGAQREWKTLRRDRRQLHGAGPHPPRRRRRVERHRGRRAPASELPGRRRRLGRRRATSSSAAWTCSATPSATPRRPSRSSPPRSARPA